MNLFRYNTIRVFTLILICTLLACVLFPPIWYGLLWLFGEAYHYSPGRTFRRIWQCSVLLGLIASYRWLGLQPPGKVGYDWNWNSLRNALIGVAVAWTFLFGLTGMYYAAGLWSFYTEYDFGEMTENIGEGFLRGLAVAGLEEYIFRGLIFLSFCRNYKWWQAALFSSLLFSALHFLQGRGLAEYESVVTWVSGFSICGGLLYELFMRFHVFPDAAGLFLIGLILCYAFHKTGTLWYSVGLHGGWVWFVSFRTSIWRDAHEAPLWFGERQLFDGIVPMITMLLIFPVSMMLIHKKILVNKPTYHHPE